MQKSFAAPTSCRDGVLYRTFCIVWQEIWRTWQTLIVLVCKQLQSYGNLWGILELFINNSNTFLHLRPLRVEILNRLMDWNPRTRAAQTVKNVVNSLNFSKSFIDPLILSWEKIVIIINVFFFEKYTLMLMNLMMKMKPERKYEDYSIKNPIVNMKQENK